MRPLFLLPWFSRRAAAATCSTASSPSVRPSTASASAAAAFSMARSSSSSSSATGEEDASKGTVNVAVLGSGIAGSTAARTLASADGMDVRVSVFEAGFGPGGRTSTRVTRDGNKFAFDHGAQYISPAKTDGFREALEEWKAEGFVREWDGRFATATVVAGAEDGLTEEEPGGLKKKQRYVGYPRMNSICAGLLDHDGIEITTQTRACASYDESTKRWTLTSHGDGDDGRTPLGTFDYLVGSDRLSATNGRADLRDAPLTEFASAASEIENVPILVLMVAFESPGLIDLPYDGILFEEGLAKFGSLGWVARDTSKPGRDRSDRRECWVVQSNPEAAMRVLESVSDELGEDATFEAKREVVRERARELLLADFLKAARELSTAGDGETTILLPKIVSATGHRWSAAFPRVPPTDGTRLLREENKACYSDKERNFVACGDYCGEFTGRVEGAYLSGRAAAEVVLDAIRASRDY